VTSELKTSQLGISKSASKLLNAHLNVFIYARIKSWLNQAEIAIGIYSRQCLGKDRAQTMQELKLRSKSWTKRANREKIRITWMFTKKKARKMRYEKFRGT